MRKYLYQYVYLKNMNCMRLLSVPVLMLITVTVFVACGHNNPKEHDHAKNEEEHAHDEEHGNANTASFTNEQIKSIGIVTGNIEEKQLTAALRTTGVLRVPNQNKANINSVYAGVVKSLLIQPGNTVRKGQTIATISNPSFVQIQSDYLNTTAKIKLAELEVTRQQELNAGNAGALKNLQSAETELRTLQTIKSTQAQQIRLMGINPNNLSNGELISVVSITSPINGVVSDVMIEMGSYIDVTTPVAQIVDNSQLHLDLFVYEKDLSKLKNGQIIHFTLTNNPEREYDAEIFSLGSSFEGASKAVSVHARVKGDKTGLIDGMNVTAVVSLDTKTSSAVPSDAIVTHQGQDYIFIVADPHADGHIHEKAETGKHTHKEGDQPHHHGATNDKHVHKEGDHHDHHDHHAETKEKHVHKAGEQHDHSHDHESDSQGVTYKRVPVVKGTTDVGYTAITTLTQIPPGAKIVTKGAFFVLAKMTNSGEHGHAH